MSRRWPRSPRARPRAAGRVADQAGEISDQKDDRVAEILKVFHLAQQHGVAEVQVGGGGVETDLYLERHSGPERLLELAEGLLLADDFDGPSPQVGELFFRVHSAPPVKRRVPAASCIRSRTMAIALQ